MQWCGSQERTRGVGFGENEWLSTEYEGNIASERSVRDVLCNYPLSSVAFAVQGMHI